jgi:antitoxin (DNA-binding transcriptional repressor) of toxin-antitoxin stability system
MTIELNDLPTRIGEVLAMIRAGVEVTLTEGGEPKAKVEPVAPTPTRQSRRLGLGEGRGGYWMAPDFDAPLSDEFWLGGNP